MRLLQHICVDVKNSKSEPPIRLKKKCPKEVYPKPFKKLKADLYLKHQTDIDDYAIVHWAIQVWFY